MARLYVFAEGHAEEAFVGAVLKPYLATLGVHAFPVKVSTGKRKGRIYRGGLLKYEPMKRDVLRFFSQEKGADVFFTTMIDLYALPKDFPGWANAEKLRSSPLKRVESIENAFARDVGDPRFIPYIQLHEYETYLFSDPTWFAYFYNGHEKQIAGLKSIADQFGDPELIDDGPETAPSKRIIALFPDYEHAKAVVGPAVAELIGLPVIRAKCGHFAGWLSKLERLAAQSP